MGKLSGCDYTHPILQIKVYAEASNKGDRTMATTYVRRFNLKDSLTDKQVGDFWKSGLGEWIPVIEKVKGVRSVKLYSGAGALRADIRLVYDMDDAGVYESVVRDPAVHKILGPFYGAI